MSYALKFTFSRNDLIFPVFEILLKVSEGDTWQDAFLKVLPERKNARPIVSVQSKEDRSQDSKSVNNAMAVDISNTVSIDVNNTIPIDVYNTVSVDVNNIVSVDVNNMMSVVKDICDKESDSKLESKADSKEILNKNPCIT